MIIDNAITSYLHSLEGDGPAFLEQLRDFAQENEVPIIRLEMESFLRVLLQMHRPKRILEIGTAIGYSSLFMDSCLPEVSITTIENYEPRLKEARKNLSGHDNITLMEGDAVELLKEMEESYDFIFLDAAKGQYITMLPDLDRLLKSGGILIADNALQDGELIKSRYVTPRRQRTIHSRMRDFIWEMKHNDLYDSALLTVGDGVVLSRKR